MAIYGEISGTVQVEGVNAERDIIGISYEPQTVDDGQGGTVERRIVVGATRSGPDGTYTLQMPDFVGETMVLCLADYGEQWLPNRAYTVGERLRPTPGNETGYVYVITGAGTSDVTEPGWIVPAGGVDTMQVGTAMVQAVQAWWSLAHAPITPQLVNTGDVVYPLEIDPYWDSVALLIQPLATDTAIDDKSGRSGAVDKTGAVFVSNSLEFPSVYFSGGDYLSVENVITDPNGPWTISAIVSPEGTGSDRTIFSSRTSSSPRGIHFAITDTGALSLLCFSSSGGVVLNIQGTIAVPNGIVSVVSATSDGATGRIFVNGVLAAAGAISGSISVGVNPAFAGVLNPGAGVSYRRYFKGFANLRITPGICRYTEDYSADELLLPASRFEPGREATIIDPYWHATIALIPADEQVGSPVISNATGRAGFVFVGDGAISSAESRFSETSAYFTGGSGGHIASDESSSAWSPGQPELTLEAWLYPTTSARTRYVFTNRNGSALANRFACELTGNNRPALVWWDSGSQSGVYGASPQSIPYNAWSHVAWVISGQNVKIFINGTLVSDSEKTNKPSIVALKLEVGYQATDAFNFIGYMQDIRVTSAARYSDDFDAPAAAFPTRDYDPLENVAELAMLEQPESVEVAAGTVAEFSVYARAYGKTVTHQWYDAADDSEIADTAAVSGSTTATLSITTTAGDDGAEYYCVADDGSDSVQSATVTLTVT